MNWSTLSPGRTGAPCGSPRQVPDSDQVTLGATGGQLRHARAFRYSAAKNQVPVRASRAAAARMGFSRGRHRLTFFEARGAGGLENRGETFPVVDHSILMLE